MKVIIPLIVHMCTCCIGTFFINSKKKKLKKKSATLTEFSQINITAEINLNSEISAEIRSKPSSLICVPCSAHQDYFYLQDFG